ncbi:MAG: class I SAM-dependent methyltransferase, partial [Solirubrobacterales bacterium]
MNDSPDLAAVTQIQQQIWSKGDFAMVANLVYFPSERLAESLEIVPDERVLDVASGSGNLALAAARRSWGNVVSSDYVPALLERGRERAAAERLDIEFVEADAQNLPFEDASFDVVCSIFGAMFAPDQQKTAE